MKSLKGKKHIEILFEEGISINVFPFRVIFIESKENAVGVSVGKRNFKLAVERNKIKRQIREGAKTHIWPVLKNSSKAYKLMLIYTGKEKPEWKQMDEKIKEAAEKFKQKNL